MATLTQAINRTTETARNNVRSNGLVSPTTDSCRQPNVSANSNGRHRRRKVAHDLLRYAIRILRRGCLGDAIFEPRDDAVTPESRGLLGKLIGREAHGNPKLSLSEADRLDRPGTRSCAA
jgi:hypothetical protein